MADKLIAMLFNIFIIFCLILLNGLFAMSELALFSSRKPLLAVRAEGGSRGARTALALLENPSHFLSTTQIGITLISILAGAFGGATLEEPVAEFFRSLDWFGDYANEVAITLVVVGISYFSLVLGELAPKHIALKRAEAIACLMSRPMLMVSRVVRPLVLLGDASNRVVLKLFDMHEESETQLTTEEVKAVIAEGGESGALDQQERTMIESVLRLDDLSVRSAMTHRQDVVSVEVGDSLMEIARKVRESRHSRYLLCEGGLDHVIGIVTAKDMLATAVGTASPPLRELAVEPIALPESASVMTALERFRSSTANFAIVVDEYGSLEGIITPKDILEAIVGTLPEGSDYQAPAAVQRSDGSWLVDGLMVLHKVEETLGLRGMEAESGDYTTLAGFVMHHLQHIPTEGEHFSWNGYRFEVVDMDGKRVDKILVTLPPVADDSIYD